MLVSTLASVPRRSSNSWKLYKARRSGRDDRRRRERRAGPSVCDIGIAMGHGSTFHLKWPTRLARRQLATTSRRSRRGAAFMKRKVHPLSFSTNLAEAS
jgi:hypothetical protein